MKTSVSVFATAVLLALFFSANAFAQGFHMHVTYVCNGERVYVESCNGSEDSDSTRCVIGHKDKIVNGFMVYSSDTIGALKKLLPTCKQPSAEDIARSEALQKKQHDLYQAQQQKTEAGMANFTKPIEGFNTGGPKVNPETAAMNRCIEAGRSPSICQGNAIFGHLMNGAAKLLGADNKPPALGPELAGAFQGRGNWRIDFNGNLATMNCGGLAPEPRAYSIDMRNNQVLVTIKNTPKPILLALKADGTLVGTGPVVVDGVVVAGYDPGSGGEPNKEVKHQSSYVQTLTPMEAQQYTGDSTLRQNGQMYERTITNTWTSSEPNLDYVAPSTRYAPRTETCSQAILSSKGAGSTVLDAAGNATIAMITGGADSGPKTPAGVRMHGLYGAQTGFSVEFFPESAIIGCGQAAHAYPYVVQATGGQGNIRIDAPGDPITLAMKPDGKLDPSSGAPYLVQGRKITSEDFVGNQTFAPVNATCNLAVLTPGLNPPPPPAQPANLKYIPGNAVLSIVSGFPAQPGAPNPLAGDGYILLRTELGAVLAKGGIQVPPGVLPYKVFGISCANHTPDCQKINAAVHAEIAAQIRADIFGKATLPGVPPGTYYLMISARYNNQPLFWGQKVDLKPGTNSVTLDQRNAVPAN